LALLLSCLALFLWVCSVWLPWLNGPPYYFPDNPLSERATAESSESEPQQGNADPPKADPVRKGWHSDERHHRQQERAFWRFSQIFIAITATGAVVAAYAAVRAYIAAQGQVTAMQGQLSEMHAEQRAWVSFDQNPVLTRDLALDENGLAIDLAFIAKNTGKNPAFRSTVNLGADFGRSPSEKWEREVCYQDSSVFGSSVFPGDKSYPRVGVQITSDQIAKAHNDIPANFRPLDITVIACAVYMDAVTGIWHHTPYAYTINYKPMNLVQGQGAQTPRMSSLPIKTDLLFLQIDPLTLTVMPPD
jgi:hypothetical protein